MSQYKLTYLNITGAGEPIRWAFKIAGVDFEDERISYEDWEKLKFSGRFPLQQVPLLEINGKVYNQSSAILRYLASKFDLLTGDALLDLKVDQTHMIVMDGFSEVIKWFREKDPERKATMKEDMLETSLRLILEQLQDIVATSDGDFIMGSKLTYADLSLACWFNVWSNVVDPEIPTRFPRLKEHKEAVESVPQIKAWLEVRPETAM